MYNINPNIEKTCADIIKLAENIESEKIFIGNIKANINQTIQSFKNKKINVLFIGQFNAGKSTLINALLGKDCMPIDVNPTNRSFAEICYGDRLKALTVENGIESEVTIDQFNERCKNSSPKQILSRLYYPSELLKEGLVFIDTPGLNDPEIEYCVLTYDYIPKADVVIYLLDGSTGGISKSDKCFIEDHILTENIKNKIWFVVNRIDGHEEKEREEIRKFVTDFVKTIIKETPRVYLLSAKSALEGRVSFDKKVIAESLIENFEKDFRNYVQSNKSIMLKNSIVSTLKSALSNIKKIVNNEENKIRLGKDEIKKMKGDTEKEITKLTIKCDADVSVLEGDIKSIEQYFNSSFTNFLNKLENALMERVNNLENEELKNTSNLNKCIEKNIKNFVDDMAPEIQKKLKTASEKATDKFRANFVGADEILRTTVPSDNAFVINPSLITLTAFISSWIFLGWMNFFMVSLGILFGKKEFEDYISNLISSSKSNQFRDKIREELAKVFEKIKNNFQKNSSDYFREIFINEKKRLQKEFDELIVPLRDKFNNPPVELSDIKIKELEIKLEQFKFKIESIGSEVEKIY